ncbi:MAG TPA: 2OG-Fe(II) oxygenase [Gammaproteobacteria bacterium]|nr:2OG-Fe(II) oxygenase [Gammaproteobacteria bacterium]
MTGDLELAAEHDAAGRHHEAIDSLARATARGDVDATVALAKRLLVGDRAPFLPQEAVRFMGQAVAAGSAEAALRLATLAALGAYVAQSWNDALEMLVVAAERGSTDAQGQLRALTDALADDDAAAWRRLAARVDLSFWLTTPEGETLHARPLVRRFPQLATGAVCEWLKRRAEGRLRRALIYDPNQGGDVVDHMRSNTIAGFSLADVDLVQVALQHRMAAACGVPVGNAEGPTILHYAPGEQITNHYDFINVRTAGYAEYIEHHGERIITFLLYLNEDYTGGETDFAKLGLRHKGKRGEGLFFTNALLTGGPDFRMVHAGLPPTRGEKWIVSQFFRNRPSLGARAENVG